RLVVEAGRRHAVGERALAFRRDHRGEVAVFLERLAVQDHVQHERAQPLSGAHSEAEAAGAIREGAVALAFDQRSGQIFEDNGHQYVISRYPSATGSSEIAASGKKLISVTCAPVPSIGLHAPS